jgi:hypothetical protein
MRAEADAVRWQDVVELVRDCSTKIDALKDATDASREWLSLYLGS